MQKKKKKKWNKKKLENSKRSIIVNCVLFQNVCDIITIQKFLFIYLSIILRNERWMYSY